MRFVLCTFTGIIALATSACSSVPNISEGNLAGRERVADVVPSLVTGGDCNMISDADLRLECHAVARALPRNTTWLDISMFDNDVSRQRHAHSRGLPTGATWLDISMFDNEASRRQHATMRGLPGTATWSDITNFDIKTN